MCLHATPQQSTIVKPEGNWLKNDVGKTNFCGLTSVILSIVSFATCWISTEKHYWAMRLYCYEVSWFIMHACNKKICPWSWLYLGSSLQYMDHVVFNKVTQKTEQPCSKRQHAQ